MFDIVPVKSKKIVSYGDMFYGGHKGQYIKLYAMIKSDVSFAPLGIDRVFNVWNVELAFLGQHHIDTSKIDKMVERIF